MNPAVNCNAISHMLPGPCRILAMPRLQETKIILATPIVRRLPQGFFSLLQDMNYDPHLCASVRRIVGRGARRNVRDNEDV